MELPGPGFGFHLLELPLIHRVILASLRKNAGDSPCGGDGPGAGGQSSIAPGDTGFTS